MIGEQDRLERGFLGMGEVSEPLITMMYLITLI